jgi:hypothetical protein
MVHETGHVKTQADCLLQQQIYSTKLLACDQRPISDINLSYSDSTALLCPLETGAGTLLAPQLGGAGAPEDTEGGGAGGAFFGGIGA